MLFYNQEGICWIESTYGPKDSRLGGDTILLGAALWCWRRAMCLSSSAFDLQDRGLEACSAMSQDVLHSLRPLRTALLVLAALKSYHAESAPLAMIYFLWFPRLHIAKHEHWSTRAPWYSRSCHQEHWILFQLARYRLPALHPVLLRLVGTCSPIDQAASHRVSEDSSMHLPTSFEFSFPIRGQLLLWFSCSSLVRSLSAQLHDRNVVAILKLTPGYDASIHAESKAMEAFSSSHYLVQD